MALSTNMIAASDGASTAAARTSARTADKSADNSPFAILLAAAAPQTAPQPNVASTGNGGTSAVNDPDAQSDPAQNSSKTSGGKQDKQAGGDQNTDSAAPIQPPPMPDGSTLAIIPPVAQIIAQALPAAQNDTNANVAASAPALPGGIADSGSNPAAPANPGDPDNISAGSAQPQAASQPVPPLASVPMPVAQSPAAAAVQTIADDGSADTAPPDVGAQSQKPITLNKAGGPTISASAAANNTLANDATSDIAADVQNQTPITQTVTNDGKPVAGKSTTGKSTTGKLAANQLADPQSSSQPVPPTSAANPIPQVSMVPAADRQCVGPDCAEHFSKWRQRGAGCEHRSAASRKIRCERHDPGAGFAADLWRSRQARHSYAQRARIVLAASHTSTEGQRRCEIRRHV